MGRIMLFLPTSHGVTMKLRRTAFAALGVALLASPSYAEVFANINIGVAPPTPRYEVVPAPRAGYVWAPGSWDWA